MINKKLWKRFASVMLIGCMAIGSLTACGNESEVSKESGSTSSETVQSSESEQKESSSEVEEVKEPAELTYYGELQAAASTLTTLNDMEIIQEAQKATNVNVTYEHPASGTAKETFNLKITSMELNDIMEYNWSSYPGSPTMAMDDGIIIDLAPYLEQGYAPNYKKILDENPDIARAVTTDDGRIFAFACLGSEEVSVTSGMIVRKDMLDKVGLDMPKTIEDWEKMLTAFKDELGVAAPYTGTASEIVKVNGNAKFAEAYGLRIGYFVDNGTVKHGILEPEMKDYVETMARWYANGLMDPEIFGNDSKAVSSNILNDKSGAAFGAVGSAIGTWTTNAKNTEGTNPDFALTGVSFPVLDEATGRTIVPASNIVRAAAQAAITTACEDIEAAMAYLDFWYSEEGHLLKNFGIEDLSYKMVNGVPTYTDLILKNPEGLSIANALGRYTRAPQPSAGRIDPGYYDGYYQMQEQLDTIKIWNDTPDNVSRSFMPTVSATAEEAEELATITASTDTYIQEELTKFIMGTRDLNEWDKFVETVKGMNIEKAIEINQAAYNRYLSR